LKTESIVRVQNRERLGFFWRRRAPAEQRENKGGENKGYGERRGLGAQFWGGPYWGFGARLGHPCQTCRSTCEGGSRSAACERCRTRCGW
jgi:hypothetical protein